MKSYLLVVLLLLGTFWTPLSRATNDDDDESDSPGWVKLRTDGAGPLPRDSIAAWGFDDGIYTFGGFTENLDPNNPRENVFFNDVWRFNVNSRKWRLRSSLPDSATNTRPEPRAYSIAGRYGDEFIVGFGITYSADFSSIKAYNDIWGFNTATQRWRRIRADGAADGGPGQRADAAHAIYNGKLYLFGGVTQFFSTKGDTWVFNFATNTWTQPVLTVQPSPRYAPSFALDKVNSRLVLYGGERSEFSDSGASFVFAGPDAQWALDFETVTWTQITPRATLSNRNNGNGAVYINDKLFVFGGDIGGGPECSNAIFQQNNLKETWIWDAKINVWTQLCPQNSPPNLKRATSVRVDNDVYMFGGFAFNSTTCGPFEFATDVWKYSVRGCYGGTPCRN